MIKLIFSHLEFKLEFKNETLIYRVYLDIKESLGMSEAQTVADISEKSTLTQTCSVDEKDACAQVSDEKVIELDDTPELSTCNKKMSDFCQKVCDLSGLSYDKVSSMWNTLMHPLPCTHIIRIGNRKGQACGEDCHPCYSSPPICPKHVNAFLKKAPAQGYFLRAIKSTIPDLYIHKVVDNSGLILVIHQKTRAVVGKIEDSSLVTSLTDEELEKVSRLKLAIVKLEEAFPSGKVKEGDLIMPFLSYLSSSTSNVNDEGSEGKEIELED